MMRSMRRSARYIFWVLAIAFVGWLALDYSGVVSQRSGSVGDIAGKVNGTEIRLETFYDAVRAAHEQRRANGQEAPTTAEGQRELEDQVFEQMVQQILLEQEYRRRNIQVTDDEVRDAAFNAPPPELMQAEQFQTEGQFDIEKYRRFLQAGASPEVRQALEARYREELPRVKLFQQLIAGYVVSDSQLWQMYRDRHDSIAVRLVRVRPEVAVADTAVSVSDADIEAYYREHREDFRQAGQAFLSYVAVPAAITAQDSVVALERAQAVLAEIRGGADFATVASRESADTTSRAEGGLLGWIRRGQTVPPFDSAVFRLRPGVVSDLVATMFGYHVIRVEAVEGDSAEVRHILLRVEIAEDRLFRIESRADSLDRIAAEQTDGELLDTAAAVLGLPVEHAMAREGQRVVLRDGRFMPDAGLWAFEARPTETSTVIEGPGGYYLFRLDSLQPERVPPLTAVRGEVTRQARIEKKAAAARAMADAIAERIRAGVSLTAAAEERGLTVVTTPAFSRLDPAAQLFSRPEVVGTAFGLGVGEVAAPVESGDDFYIVELVTRHLAERSVWELQKEAQRNQVLTQLRQQRISEMMQSLRASADVVDRRREIERVQRELADRQPVTVF